MDREKIRILRVIARLNIGGPALHVGLVSRGLDELGFETTLAAGSLAAGEGDMAGFVRSLGVNPVFIASLRRELHPLADLTAFLKLLALMKKVRPHIVHTHTAKAGAVGRGAAAIYNLLNPNRRIVVVHTFHGHVLRGYFSRLKSRLFVLVERLLARFTDALVVLSPRLKEELAGTFRIAPVARFRVVGLGFDLSPFIRCQSDTNGVLEEVEASGEARLAGMVGRLVPVKNTRLFLESLAMLSPKRGGRVHGLVVGDGELRPELEALAQELDIADKVTFTGWRRELPRIYAALSVLALTSINEGTPVSIIEAMASGVPVVATGVGGVPDLLGKETGREPGLSIRERGIMVTEAAPKAFCRGMELVLEDQQLASKIADRAREYATERFDVKRLIRELGDMYLELLGKGKTGK